jgi:hypothetical protein
VGDGLIAVEKGHVAEIDLPIEMAGSARIIGVVGWAALSKRRKDEEEKKQKYEDQSPQPGRMPDLHFWGRRLCKKRRRDHRQSQSEKGRIPFAPISGQQSSLIEQMKSWRFHTLPRVLMSAVVNMLKRMKIIVLCWLTEQHGRPSGWRDLL